VITIVSVDALRHALAADPSGYIVGVRASLMAFLHEAYTSEVVGVFDGLLIEWALHGDLPVHGPPML